jgi:hypothetical protein
VKNSYIDYILFAGVFVCNELVVITGTKMDMTRIISENQWHHDFMTHELSKRNDPRLHSMKLNESHKTPLWKGLHKKP